MTGVQTQHSSPIGNVDISRNWQRRDKAANFAGLSGSSGMAPGRALRGTSRTPHQAGVDNFVGDQEESCLPIPVPVDELKYKGHETLSSRNQAKNILGQTSGGEFINHAAIGV
jgi:hypothetical protein